MAMGTRKKRERQEDLWIASSEVVGTPAHAFYDRLNQILSHHHFDRRMEQLCRRYYKGRLGRPSITHATRPGVTRVRGERRHPDSSCQANQDGVGLLSRRALEAVSSDRRRRNKAHFIRGEVFTFPRTGELDIGDTAGFDGHFEDGDWIARRFAARNRFQTGAVDHLAFDIESFEQSGCPGRSPERNRDGRDRLWESGADRNGLGCHGAGDPLVAGGEMSEKHDHSLAFGLLGFMGECERDTVLFPSREAVRLAVGHQRYSLFEVHHDLFGGPGVNSRGQQQECSWGDGADQALVMSRPDIVPVEKENLAVSIPMRQGC